MGTIITVHGTGASGPSEGHLWWQRGSQFETDVRKCVDAEEGELRVIPFIWDGHNSESSRRIAGYRLYRLFCELENRGDMYCVIGHSHGGSVIGHALLAAAAAQQRLPLLSRWITVATPFIQMREKRGMYSALQPIDRLIALIVVAIYLPFAAVWAFNAYPTANYFMKWIMFSIPNGLLLLYLKASIAARTNHYNIKNGTAAHTAFAVRRLNFLHREDEAVSGLAAIRSNRFPIIASRFAVPALRHVCIFLIAAAFIVLLRESRDLIEPLPEMLGDGAVKIAGIELERRVLIFSFLFLVVPAVLIGACLLLLPIATRVSQLGSRLLAIALNSLTWNQIRQTAFGNDLEGETAESIYEWPWVYFPGWKELALREKSGLPPPGTNFLPRDLSVEVTKIADLAAGRAISKFRGAIAELAFAGGSEAQTSSSLSDYFTWDELIHTAYFNSQAFRRLVCWGIASTAGFEPRSALLLDPDLPKLRSWLTEVEEGSRKATALYSKILPGSAGDRD